ncbi:MAG: hypothetical protein ACLFTT_16135 [Candidatus Hydrogenedentota bacterium]
MMSNRVISTLMVVAAVALLAGCPTRPRLGVSTDVLRFEVDANGNYETVKTFEVFNRGKQGLMLDFTVSADQGWIQVDPVNDNSIGEDAPVTVTVTIDRDFVAKNTPEYATGTITVHTDHEEKAIAVTTAPNYFTEEYAGSVDLDQTQLVMAPTGGLSFYGAVNRDLTGTDYPTDPAGGLVLDFLSMGDPVETELLLGKSIPFYGEEISRFYISSKGAVGMGGPGSDGGTPEEHFAQPQISVFPMDAATDGEVSILQDDEKFVVTYDDVPTAAAAKQGMTNDIQLEMYFNGEIRISYLQADPAAQGVIGLSSGGGAGTDDGLPVDFVDTDLSEVDVNTSNVKLGF